jgi:MarR family 2-MHQ and catechol resistance regulon transcriptional repressor
MVQSSTIGAGSGALDAYVKLMRAAESVTARLERGLRRAGLTTSQFGVMEALHHLGPLCQGELAQKILKSNGNLTTVVDNLERRGLVERRRDSGDRRRVEVRLTETGADSIAKIFPTHARAVEEIFSVLDDQQRRELAALCRSLGLATARPASEVR